MSETKKAIDISKLSAQDRQALLKQLEEQQLSEKRETAQRRANYKDAVDKEVNKLYPMLQKASETLAKAKVAVYERLSGLVQQKAVVFGSESDQASHNFSTKDGNITIIIGYNIIDGWDDTANVGMEKVNSYLRSLGKNKDSKILVESITKLLSKDSKGNLKASRILQLKQIADRTENREFIDAIQIIQDAYRPVRSKEYVRCLYKGTDGTQMILPLSITDAALPVKEQTN